MLAQRKQIRFWGTIDGNNHVSTTAVYDKRVSMTEISDKSVHCSSKNITEKLLNHKAMKQQRDPTRYT